MTEYKPSFARHLVVALLAGSLFAWVASVALAPAVPAVDRAVRDAVHAAASPPLTAIMKATTNLGGGWFLWPCGVLIVGLLVRLGRRRDAIVFAAAVLGANLLDESMKLFFQRPRPEPFFGYDKPSTFSFPSGHAFVSFCFYFALAEVLGTSAWPPARRAALWGAAALLILTIGLSRVYLGVHYPTDVAGGYAAGLAWACAVRYYHRRGDPGGVRRTKPG